MFCHRQLRPHRGLPLWRAFCFIDATEGGRGLNHS
jgi:hypothetical protein